MKNIFLFATALTFLGLLPTASQAVTSKSYFFHCDPSGLNYQIGFHPAAGGTTATQRHQGLDKYSSIDEENVVTNFSVDNESLQYSKLGSSFKIGRTDGVVLRDDQPSPHVCKEVSRDLVAAAAEEIKRAKTTKTEFWSMTTGMGDTDYVRLGTLATSDDICRVFKHPFFAYSKTDYQLVDRVSSDFSWDGIQAASIWINRKFREGGVTMRRFALMQNIHQAANENISACLARKELKEPGFYQKLTSNFLTNLGYMGVECHKQDYRTEQDVDDEGNLIRRKIAIGGASCIDFNYNSGRLNDWNPSTFTLMLIWKEAHPVLEKILDGGQKVVEERAPVRMARQQADAARQEAFQQERARVQKAWSDYDSRQKTVMEQVYNLATSGFVDGRAHDYWIEKEECMLTNGSQTIDNRSLNMTAFRIRSEFLGSDWAIVSSDQKMRLVTFQKVPVDRLQRAWGMAFDKCPGKSTRF
jgi:hypothetical protein